MSSSESENTPNTTPTGMSTIHTVDVTPEHSEGLYTSGDDKYCVETNAESCNSVTGTSPPCAIQSFNCFCHAKPHHFHMNHNDCEDACRLHPADYYNYWMTLTTTTTAHDSTNPRQP